MRFLFALVSLITTAFALPAETSYEKDVKPIFRDKCYGCHGPTQQMGGLRLDDKRTVLSGGRGRPDLVPGALDRSSIYLRISGTTQGQRMPLTGALEESEIATIKQWILEGAKWPDEPPPARDWKPDHRLAPLFEQTRRGKFKAIRDAVSADSSLLRARDARGDTLLMHVALNNKAEDLQWLLSKGADPNIANLAGSTALMWAIDDLAKLRVLLAAGANPNAHTDNGKTALMIAADQKQAAPILAALLEKGAKADPEPGQADPLAQVAANGDLDSMKLLVKARGGKFPAVALTAAAQSDCMECLKLILDQMPSATALSDALRGAARLGQMEALEMLLRAGADPNAKDGAGGTALLRASYTDFPDAARVKLLLEHGADVNARDAGGDTPLMKAKRKGQTQIVQLLAAAGAKE